MVNRKERIKMNMIGGYKDGTVSGQVSLHFKLDKNHDLNIVGDRLKSRNSVFPVLRKKQKTVLKIQF